MNFGVKSATSNERKAVLMESDRGNSVGNSVGVSGFFGACVEEKHYMIVT